jgi:hypothetical protein
MGHIVAHVWLQLSHENGLVTMVEKPNSSWSDVGWYKFCIHLRIMNFWNFRMVEATRLKL